MHTQIFKFNCLWLQRNSLNELQHQSQFHSSSFVIFYCFIYQIAFCWISWPIYFCAGIQFNRIITSVNCFAFRFPNTIDCISITYYLYLHAAIKALSAYQMVQQLIFIWRRVKSFLCFFRINLNRNFPRENFKKFIWQWLMVKNGLHIIDAENVMKITNHSITPKTWKNRARIQVVMKGIMRIEK